MLESDCALRTWALREMPQMSSPGKAIAAEKLPNHRLAYLEYEGPVSGERGTVGRVDTGTFETIVESQGRLEIRIDGGKLRGKLTIHRTEMDWALTIEP